MWCRAPSLDINARALCGPTFLSYVVDLEALRLNESLRCVLIWLSHSHPSPLVRCTYNKIFGLLSSLGTSVLARSPIESPFSPRLVSSLNPVSTPPSLNSRLKGRCVFSPDSERFRSTKYRHKLFATTQHNVIHGHLQRFNELEVWE